MKLLAERRRGGRPALAAAVMLALAFAALPAPGWTQAAGQGAPGRPAPPGSLREAGLQQDREREWQDDWILHPPGAPVAPAPVDALPAPLGTSFPEPADAHRPPASDGAGRQGPGQPAALDLTGDDMSDGAPRHTGALTPVAAPLLPGAAAAAPLVAGQPAPPPDIDVNAAVADAAIMDMARALLASPQPFADSRLDKGQQARLQTFYAGRSSPLWLRETRWSDAARNAQARLDRAWEEGLDSADYAAPDIAPDASLEALAEAEVRLSINAVKYARDASGARIAPARLSRFLTPQLDLPDADLALGRLAAAMAAGENPGDVLASWNPSHPGYRALRARLITLRASRPPEPPAARIPPGPALRVGMQDPRVTLVRSRLGLTPSEDASYDERLAAAVAEFQRSRGLKPTGVLTRQTVLAMAGDDIPATEDEAVLVVNMERWRWLPRDLGPDYIFVNIPEYRMRLIRGGRPVYETRVIVGKPETPTPVFSDVMQYVAVNPYWNVPPSIMKKEFLPGLARDPAYAARRGYEVIRRGGQIYVRQPPGERNALGRIKFMFPNGHAVYLHDTPSRALFGRQRRAFSHGCVRVDDPLRFAGLILGEQWPASRIRKLFGPKERTIRLPQRLPIHLAYFTAAVDPDGVLHAREDIYGIDRRMNAALARPSAAR